MAEATTSARPRRRITREHKIEPVPLSVHALLSEVVGTFLLMFFGTGAVIQSYLADPAGEVDLTLVALAWGVTVMIVVYAFGHVSGAHVNPSVTIALAVVGRFPWPSVVPYLVAQLVGATAASLTLWGLFGGPAVEAPLSLGVTLVGDGFTALSAVLAEVVITFLLLVVVMATALDERAITPAVGLGVGFTIAAGIFVVAPISGASFNAARTLAPMLVTGAWDNVWVWLLGPVVGAILGAYVYDLALRPGEPPTVEGAVAEHE